MLRPKVSVHLHSTVTSIVTFYAISQHHAQIPTPQVSSDDLLGVGLALCRLAEQLVAPAAAKGAAEAFRAFDMDGSGYLDFGESARRAPTLLLTL